MRLTGMSVLLLALSGCVTTGEFNKQVEKTEAETKRADDTAKEFEAAKKSIEEQKTAIEAHKKSIGELETKLSASQQQVKGGEDQIASLTSKLQAEEQQLAALQKSNKALTDTLDASRNDLKQKVSDLTKQGDELAQKVANLNQKVAELSQKNGDLTQKNGELAQQLTQAQTEKDALQKQKDEEVARVKKSFESVTASLKSDIEKGAVQIKQLQGKLTLNLVDKVLFKPGEADVNEDGRKVLERIGEVLNNVADKDIRIEGHTDDKPITGELKARFPSNWELSAARATAVARYLQDHAHVDAKRLIVTGYGQYRPISANDTPENRALNRRIELVLVPRD